MTPSCARGCRTRCWRSSEWRGGIRGHCLSSPGHSTGTIPARGLTSPPASPPGSLPTRAPSVACVLGPLKQRPPHPPQSQGLEEILVGSG